jgi:hypothetical protein
MKIYKNKLVAVLSACLITITSVFAVSADFDRLDYQYAERSGDVNFIGTDAMAQIAKDVELNYGEESFCSFMPLEWFKNEYVTNRQSFDFFKYVGISMKAGYEFNPEDYPELNILSVETDNDGYVYAIFSSFDEAYYALPIIEADEKVYSARLNFQHTELGVLLDLKDYEEYLTYDDIVANIDKILANETMLDRFGKGDFDGDTITSVNDTVMYLKAIQNPQIDLTSVEFYRADIHQDGKVDVVDLVVCVNKILEQ